MQTELRETALHLQTKGLFGDDETVLGVKLSIANYGLGSAVINSARVPSQLVFFVRIFENVEIQLGNLNWEWVGGIFIFLRRKAAVQLN